MSEIPTVAIAAFAFLALAAVGLTFCRDGKDKVKEK